MTCNLAAQQRSRPQIQLRSMGACISRTEGLAFPTPFRKHGTRCNKTSLHRMSRSCSIVDTRRLTSFLILILMDLNLGTHLCVLTLMTKATSCAPWPCAPVLLERLAFSCQIVAEAILPLVGHCSTRSSSVQACADPLDVPAPSKDVLAKSGAMTIREVI
ncbi:hypothetical protein F4778DRAFT_597243 [Xylariomycetidae sp. FL2044]|nr:hypothetical protein F4778DRAFT_597243 [Xylariomycetidae sp. FL2044]